MSNEKPTSGAGGGFTPNLSSIAVRSLVVEPQPNESLFPLTRDKFELLRSGDVSEEKQSRNVSVGIFAGAAIGIVSLGASTGWKLGWGVMLMLALALASGALTIVLHLRCHHAKAAPGSARVTREIETFFEGNVPSSGQ